MNIPLYFSLSKATYVATELKAERSSMRFNELQKLERIRANPKRPTTHLRMSLWFAVVPREFWTFQNIRCVSMNSAISVTSNIFAEPERTATNYNFIGYVCHESGIVAVRRKSLRCDLGFLTVLAYQPKYCEANKLGWADYVTKYSTDSVTDSWWHTWTMCLTSTNIYVNTRPASISQQISSIILSDIVCPNSSKPLSITRLLSAPIFRQRTYKI